MDYRRLHTAFHLTPPQRRALLGALVVVLLASILIHSSAAFYDHDEIGHYISLESMTKAMWFKPWQRAGFKLLYLPLKGLSLEWLRVVNLLVIVGIAALLYRVAGGFVALVFLTFPFVHQVGARFYSEVPAMLLIALAIRLLQKRRMAWFALVLSYAVLVRFETAVMFLPAVYVLRRHRRAIPLLFVFPVAYYLASVAVSGHWTMLIDNYVGYTHEHAWKGEAFHYFAAVFRMAGLWPLLAFPELVLRLKRGDDLMRFMAVSTILVLLLLTFSYWRRTGFGPVLGIERYVLVVAPMIAIFAGIARTPYRVPLMLVGVVIPLLLPLKKPDVEVRTLDSACAALGELDYRHLFVEHGYVNLCLGEPLHSDRVDTLEFRGRARPGDLMLWENHYAARIVPYDSLENDWYPVWEGSTGGFDAWILRRR